MTTMIRVDDSTGGEPVQHPLPGQDHLLIPGGEQLQRRGIGHGLQGLLPRVHHTRRLPQNHPNLNYFREQFDKQKATSVDVAFNYFRRSETT